MFICDCWGCIPFIPMCTFPHTCASISSFYTSVWLANHRPCPCPCMCVFAFPRDSGVQTILQASYESWGLWLHKAARRKERKTDREKKEESICFHPQPSRGELRPVTPRETASCCSTHMKKLGGKNTEYSGVPLKLSGTINSLVFIIKKIYTYIKI